MPRTLTCTCGATHAVSVAQAGLQIICECGNSIEVPQFSALNASNPARRLSTTVERIQEMIRAGSLPAGNLCPYSGRQAKCIVYVRVQWIRDARPESTLKAFWKVMTVGWNDVAEQAIDALPDSSEHNEPGIATSIEVPIRVAADVREKIMRIRNRRKLRELLRMTPIYAELLREHPNAAIEVVRLAE